MPNAIAGAMTTMTNGNTTASTRTRTASRRLIATRGEDRSMAGRSVHADMVQSEFNRIQVRIAMTGGSSSVAQNASAASLRSGVAGHAISLRTARLGRAATKTRTSGTAT